MHVFKSSPMLGARLQIKLQYGALSCGISRGGSGRLEGMRAPSSSENVLTGARGAAGIDTAR